MRRGSLSSLICITCTLLISVWGAVVRGDEPIRPNVILMLADDMGMGDSSAYQDYTGNSDQDQIHTPAMERLARMGVRFTDAHTPSSRCTTTRYGLLTGRYAWRSRLKHWVLFGSQGDPLIEADRPTIATMLRQAGYRTAMVGKWHVGLRYRRSDGGPAAGWKDADLQKPLWDSPLDHGFDFCRITSRSHGTSGPNAIAAGQRRAAGRRKRNGPTQNVGPGHIHGREAIAATSNGKQLRTDGPHAYVLSKLGGRHSDSAIEFLDMHLNSRKKERKPFFLYYACNANHAPYTPDDHIGAIAVKGRARNIAGEPLNARSDFVFENDAALGRLIDYLEETVDARNPGKRLIETTLVLFTSDNGAERDDKAATGPFRSNKGSVYEGGHRVPYLVAWSRGGIGDGNHKTPGQTNDALTGLQDIYASLAELARHPTPNHRRGEKGGEDSHSAVAAWRGQAIANHPIFFHDHKQAQDPAASAMRINHPSLSGKTLRGKWKMLFDARLLRRGVAAPLELYELGADPQETTNLLERADLAHLVRFMRRQAELHRNAGGHHLAHLASGKSIVFDFRKRNATELRHEASFVDAMEGRSQADIVRGGLRMTISQSNAAKESRFHANANGIGLSGGEFKQVDAGEALLIRFDQDVLIQSVGIVAGEGNCGGFFRIAANAPLAIYCIDADIDANDQSGLISDIGVLRAGERLRLDSSPHLGVESPGRWRLQSLSVKAINASKP